MIMKSTATVRRMANIKRRTRSDGSISYSVRWREGGARDGKEQHETLEDETAAERFRDLVNGSGQHWPKGWVKGQGFVDEDQAAALVRESKLFQPWAHRYIEHLTGVDAKTRRDYTRLVDRMMVPWFGELDVADDESFTDDHVAKWVNDLQTGKPDPREKGKWLRKPYSPKYIANMHGLLYSIMQKACDTRPALRTYNPCAKTKLPRKDDNVIEEMVFLDHAEFALLLNHLSEAARDVVMLAAGTGMRWGELSAVQVRDVLGLDDAEDTPRIRVERAWKFDEHDNMYLGAPKTRRSRRTLPLSKSLVKIVHRLMKDKEPEDYLLLNPRSGSYWTRHAFYNGEWEGAVRDARAAGLGKRPRIHDLRHTYVSWLIDANIPLPRVQRLAGHESITTTVDRYGHLLVDRDRDVTDAIDRALTGGRRRRLVSVA